jgi:tetratricopeptide (TPR) repeat protein
MTEERAVPDLVRDPSHTSEANLAFQGPPEGQPPKRGLRSFLWRTVTLPVSLARKPGRLLAISLLLLLIGLGVYLTASHLRALYHFRAGQKALSRYHYPEAYEHLQVSLNAWPTDRTTLLLAARAARRIGAYDDAERYLDTYYQTYHDTDELTLERVLLRADRGQVDAVRPYCEAQIEKNDPATPLILEALVHGCIHSLRFQEATHYLEQWKQRQPDNPQLYAFAGLLQETRDLHVLAIASYRRVLELDPQRDEIRLKLTNLLLNLVQAREALPHLEYLRQKYPNNLEVATGLAGCLAQLNRQEEAFRLLEEVLTQQPDYAPALAERGRLALQANHLVQAEKDLRQACEVEPGLIQTRYQLYRCLVALGRKAEAAKQLVHLKHTEQDLQRIKEIVETEIPRNPNDPALPQELGVILIRAGDYLEGERKLHQALQLDPHYAPAHQALADFYEQMGNHGRAARQRRLAEQASERGASGGRQPPE